MSSIRLRGCIICGLCAALFLASVVREQPASSRQVTSPLILAAQRNAVSEIILNCRGENGRLVLGDGGKWYFVLPDGVNVPADSGRMARFFSVLTDVRVLFPLSKDEAQWSAYGLDEESAAAVTFLSAGQVVVAELYFGRDRFGGSEIAVRTGRDISSWITRNDIGAFLSCHARDWCSMELTSFAGTTDFPSGIQYAAVHAGEESYVLQRRSNALWQMDGRGSVPDAHVADWLVRLGVARGLDVVTGNRTGSVASSVAGIVSLVDGNGNEYTYTVSEYGGDGMYFTFANNAADWGFVISRWTKERLLPSAATFLK